MSLRIVTDFALLLAKVLAKVLAVSDAIFFYVGRVITKY